MQSWAAKRKTTRVEDLAYCLLGIFDVNMPMLYGEGQKSFIRLQEEIMKSSYDHTLFAWSPFPPISSAEGFIREDAVSSTSEPKKLYGLLAESPTFFLHSNDTMPLEDDFQSGNNVTTGSGWIAIQLPTFQTETQLFAALSCIAGSSYLALPLDTWYAKPGRSDFVARRAELVLVPATDLYTPSGELVLKRLLVKPPIQEPMHAPPPLPSVSYSATSKFKNRSEYRIVEVHCSPSTTYDNKVGKFTLTPGQSGLHAACLLEPRNVAQIPARKGYFHKAAVLIGGDVTPGGGLWVAIVPVLPDAGTDDAFHKLYTRNPRLTTHCTTRSMLVDQLASGSGVSAFSEVGRPKVVNWFLGGEYGRFRGYIRHLLRPAFGTFRLPEGSSSIWQRVIYASASIDVTHAHISEKAFEITIKCETRYIG